MSGMHLAVDQTEVPALELPHQMYERDFRRIGSARKHRFAKEYAAERDAVKPARKFAVNPGFDGMRDALFVQCTISGDHFISDPGPVLCRSWLRARLHHGAKAAVGAYFVRAVAHHLG